MVASSLFHFTKSLDKLISIIKSRSLWTSYCEENIEDLDDQTRFVALPMVCFCDIPLTTYFSYDYDESEFEKHGRYGSYGIGLRKDKIVQKYQVNPLLYRNIDSLYAFNHRESLRGIEKLSGLLVRENLSEKSPNFVLEFELLKEELLIHLKEQSYFTKPFHSEHKIYYEAREWRYLTPADKAPRQVLETDNAKEEVEKLNSRYHQRPDFDKVFFNLEDITHIIVKSSDEVEDMIQNVNEIMDVNEDEKFKALQKIIDVVTIKRDM
ncbi:abortive infection system antitoxin AbiGi family protein [Reichenbachiella sp.]|uniref:abortive infection system antitoxin AbiGi family protein n=1 Tax=Reichenbachiella sp. TaxID=2184521 RepID=UPI003B5B60F9